MNLKRRTILKQLPFLAGMPHLMGQLNYNDMNPDHINWDEVKRSFPISNWKKLHMNSGSAGVMPIPVQDYVIEAIKYMNVKAPYEVWNEWQDIKEQNLLSLQQMIGAQENSIEVVRNTTEALNMIITGLQLKGQDEIIISNNAYPFAINAWFNKAQREDLSIKNIEYVLPLSDQEIVKQYESAITPHTKVIHITHMTHQQGHIQPISKIIEMARSHNIEVVVDGAHCVGHMPLDMQKSDIDYYASSLHKWLNAPHGTGLIYVRPELIGRLHNHPSSYLNATDQIKKFEHIGTRAFHQEIGISAALNFHNNIGLVHKMNRLQSLKEYWVKALEQVPSVQLHTDVDAKYSGAIATIAIDGYSGSQLVKLLDRDHDIHIKAVSGLWGSGLRVSVNIFHDYADMDRFVAAIRDIAA